ncbi:MAG: 5'/3'-nucleotidase SurE [Hyphomicrobium sp.]
MRILVTNDDGINAPGLHALREIANKLSDDVWVVAPETNQSGASHSLTLHEPLRCRDVDERVYAIKGTPTDCVIMGVRHILKDNPPTLVLSGVNRGSNIAEDVTYSGTIAGAIEGTLLGVRSIALSLSMGFDPEGRHHWETTLAHGPGLITSLLDQPFAPGVLMNVNFPDLPPDDVAGIAITTQGKRDPGMLHIDERADTWGTPYYWFGFERRKSRLVENTDLWAMAHGLISVTPLSVDLTHGASLAALAKRFPTPKKPRLTD